MPRSLRHADFWTIYFSEVVVIPQLSFSLTNTSPCLVYRRAPVKADTHSLPNRVFFSTTTMSAKRYVLNNGVSMPAIGERGQT